MKLHLPMILRNAVLACYPLVACCTLYSGSMVTAADLTLGNKDSLSVDYAEPDSITNLMGGSLQLIGDTQLNLSNCGEGDGKLYTLFTGISQLTDKDGNILSAGNYSVADYFNTNLPGTGFWANATLQLTQDGTLQLVRHNEQVKSPLDITTRQTTDLEYQYHESTSFHDISVASNGGAIYGDIGNTIKLSNNGSVIFRGNNSVQGGAIYGWDLKLSNNGSVSFTENNGIRGGAIYGGDLTLSNNSTVVFENNTSSGMNANGGAIVGSKLNFIGNDELIFRANNAIGEVSNSGGWSGYGGAIADQSGEGSINLIDNKSVTFTGNTATLSGGAIDASRYNYDSKKSESSIQIINNRDVEFSQNRVNGENEYGVKGGAIATYHLALCDNGDVDLSGNIIQCNDYQSLSGGGAIYSYGNLSIRNNNYVEFSKNAEVVGGIYRLRSIYSEGGWGCTISLSAAEGKNIEFRDSVYVASGSTVSFNADYTDEQGVVHQQAGDIIFTGKYTETHLNEILETEGVGRTATNEEILNSRTTEVYAMTELYGGRLCVEDGAIYKGNGITAMSGSDATVRVKNATLEHNGYDLIFKGGTTLELVEQNIISGNVLMEAGSILSFVYSEGMQNQAAMTLRGSLTLGGDVNLVVHGIDEQIGNHLLITLDDAELNGWETEGYVLTNGKGERLDSSRLVWVAQSLYYINSVGGSLTWTNASGNGVWDSHEKNWNAGGVSLGSTLLQDVNFSANEGEQVTLKGTLLVNHLNVNKGGHYDFAEAVEGAGLSVAGDMTVAEESSVDIQLREGVQVEGTLRSSGELKVNKISGKGSVSVWGGSLELADDEDALAVEGSVQIENTELRGTWTGVGLSICDSRVADGAEVSLKNVTLASTLQNEGILVLGGKVTIQSTGLDATWSGIDYSAGENGYQYEKKSYTLVAGNGTTAAMHETEWEVQGDPSLTEDVTYTYTDGVLHASGPQDVTKYWVNSSVNYDARSEFATADTLVLNGGNLTLSKNLDSNLTGGIRVDASGTLTLEKDVSLSRSELSGISSANKVTLQGVGLLNLQDSADFTGYSLGKNWQGTVALRDIKTNSSLNLHSIGQAGSTIELQNTMGYTGDSGKTITADLVLKKSTDAQGMEQAAFLVSDGYSSTSSAYTMNTFSGNVSGEGKMVFSKSLSSTYTGFTFTGNVADWTGAFEMSGGKTFNLVFKEKASEININVSNTGTSTTLNLMLGADADMSVNGDISTSSISVSNDKEVSFGGVVRTGSLQAADSRVSFAKSAIISGDMETSALVLATGATVNVGGCLTTGSIVMEGLQQNAPALTVGSFNTGNVMFELNGDALSALNLGHGESITIATSNSSLADGFKALMANGTDKMTVTVYDYFISQNDNNVVITADYANWGNRVWYKGEWIGDSSWKDMLIGGYSAVDGVETVDLMSEILEAENLYITPGSGCSSVVITNGEIYAENIEQEVTVLSIGSGATLSASYFSAEDKEVNLQGVLEVSDASIGVLSGTTGTLNIYQDGSVEIDSNVTLGDFASEGTLDIGEHTLNVAGAVSNAGSVTAAEVKVHNKGKKAVHFDTLVADKVTVTNSLSSSSYTDALSVGDGSAIGELVAETLEVREGTVMLGRSDGSTDINLQNLDLQQDATLELNQATKLTVTNELTATEQAIVKLNNGAGISYGDFSVTNRGVTAPTEVDAYKLSEGELPSLSNAHVTVNSSGDTTITAQLSNSAVQNVGTGTLTVNHGDNSLTDIYAMGGDIVVMNAVNLNLQELEVAAGMSLSAYVENVASADYEAKVSVSGKATLGLGATLNADLVIESGATLELGGAVDMGSDLYLNSGTTLGGSLLTVLRTAEIGSRIDLFTGIDSLYFNGVKQGNLTLSDGISAEQYFSNLTDELNRYYYLTFDDSLAGAGVLSIEVSNIMVPEPTTVTLSLLALAGLAARRRRK